MVEVYADESENKTAGIFTLAGWIGEPRDWRRLTAMWKQMVLEAPHPITEFHMADIAQGKGEFTDDNEWTQPERDALVKRATDILVEIGGKGDLAGYACTIVQSELEWTQESATELWKVCYGIFMHIVGIGTAAYGFTGLDFFFDDRDKVRGHVDNFFWPAKRELDRDQRLSGFLKGTSFNSSASLEPLQAADFLAYEKCKRASDRISGQSNRRRVSYKRLCEIPHRFVVLDGKFRVAINAMVPNAPGVDHIGMGTVFQCLQDEED